MPRPAITWVTTDTHFNHQTMVVECGRPADFGERIRREWKKVIAPQDTLVHLGDVIFYKYPDLKGIMDAVPGRKILVMGNHDVKSRGWYMRNGFDFACDAFINDGILFSHKPVEVLPNGLLFNLHGHWHTLPTHDRPAWWSPKTHCLMCLEHDDYRPINLEIVVNRWKAAASV